MKTIPVLFLLLGILCSLASPIPAGYQLVYSQDFETADSLKDFVMSDPSAWAISASDKGRSLELKQQSHYKPSVRSPVNIALIANKVFGDFVLEASLKQTGKEYGHRDMCLYFGFQEPSKFYYSHIATKTDDHAHNIFIVNEQPRTKISHATTPGVNWGLDIWHKVRLVRQGAEIKVFFNDMEKPVMEAENDLFKSGYIGFGSFDDTGMVDDIKIWAPQVERKETPFFKQPN